MTPALIITTVAVVLYSLWVRRDTWWSRWEAGATFAIAMEGIGLLLVTPWASDELGPAFHSFTGFWNVPQLLGFFCLLVGILGNVYHMLVRLTDPSHVLPIMRRDLGLPLGLGVASMLVTFVKTDRGHEPDMFATLTGDRWLIAFEVTIAAMAVFLAIYIGRLMLLLRRDPRAGTTLSLYVVALAFALTTFLITAVSIWADRYVGTVGWFCVCLAVGIFAWGLARSWQAKTAWFTSDPSPQQ